LKAKRFIISILILILTCSPLQVFAAGNARTSNTANLRGGPGIFYNVVKSLPGGTDLTITGKELGWFKVEAAGVTGYISDTLVTITDPSVAAKYTTVYNNYEMLATYTTRFSASDVNRNHNMELSGYKNSKVVKPGEAFSFNRNTGNSTTTANGWRESIVIVNKERVRGIGGGICQTSSTIHSAVRQIRGLTILERHPHSIPVGYVPIVNEAMVNYGSADFRFRNDLGYSIYVDVKISHTSGSLTASVYKINTDSPSKPPEPPKPKDTPQDIKRAYISQMKTIMSNPRSLLQTIKSDIPESNISYIECHFTIEDIDKNGKYDLLLYYTIHTNNGGSSTYNLLYSFNTENMYLAKTNLAIADGSELQRVSAFKNTSTNTVSWFTLDFGKGTATEITSGFKDGKVYTIPELMNSHVEYRVNKTPMSYEEVVAFEKSPLFKPNTVASVSVNGQLIKYNLPPQTIEDRVYIEMRSLFESLGYTVEYDDATRRTVVSSGAEQIILENGYESKEVIHIKDGIQESIPVEIPIRIVEDRTVFPLRLAGEILGYEVGWDGNSFTAYLDKVVAFDASSGDIIDGSMPEDGYDIVYDGRDDDILEPNEMTEQIEAPEETGEVLPEVQEEVDPSSFEEISVVEEIGEPVIDTDETNING
jgi:uncharacterized protein YraI